MTKLSDWLLGKTSGEQPEVDRLKSIHNPLGLTIDARMKLDVLDYRGESYRLDCVREYSFDLPHLQSRVVDYDLARDGEGAFCRLRLVPEPPGADFPYRAILLTMMDQLGYDDGFHEVLKDPSGRFLVTTHDGEEKDYYRPNSSHDPENYRPVLETAVASVTTMVDENRDGKVSSSEVSKQTLEIWDYSRTATIEGVETNEFVYVEMDKENGWFQLWVGQEVLPDAIEIF